MFQIGCYAGIEIHKRQDLEIYVHVSRLSVLSSTYLMSDFISYYFCQFLQTILPLLGPIKVKKFGKY
jgi:hypothetical protein